MTYWKLLSQLDEERIRAGQPGCGKEANRAIDAILRKLIILRKTPKKRKSPLILKVENRTIAVITHEEPW